MNISAGSTKRQKHKLWGHLSEESEMQYLGAISKATE